MKSFIKIREAVEYYGIGKNIFYKAIHAGELKAYLPNCRDYLLKISEIESWIETKQVNAKD
jgi:excisionase family DNA binding protein